MLMINYRLRIMVPEYDGLPDYILEDADAQDVTDEDKIRRYLGASLSNAENILSDGLPEGWYARVEEK